MAAGHLQEWLGKDKMTREARASSQSRKIIKNVWLIKQSNGLVDSSKNQK